MFECRQRAVIPRRAGRRLAALALLALAGAGAHPSSAAPRDDGQPADWLQVDYGELVDRRRPSHSGESVGELLAGLAGRPYPAPGQAGEDRAAHTLLDPLVEPYAFVLADAVDALLPLHEPPYVEIGSLWSPGEAQPAWVELLKARHYLVESDGAGAVRAFLPRETDEPVAPSGPSSAEAARAAWSRAWPVLRLVLAAERRRLDGKPLSVRVHAYRHLPARSRFELGAGAAEIDVGQTRPDGRRPPLDLAEVRRFVDAGLRLEGARLDPAGRLHLLGSVADEPPTLLGRRVALADLAVAYRAVFHGGRAEPYMSLDRGYFPESSIVNYGGRLRDTALGMVSLLCDIRFKTFSLGVDVSRGADLRDEVRAAVPGFLTHVERLAADARSSGLVRQQTRLWFYPDEVDLTISPEGDTLVLRKVRMSAASERFAPAGGTAAAEDAPWTRDTVSAINRDYDALAGLFPEMADLDQVVRLLSLFAWLRHAERGGRIVPELEPLLAVELPELPTPRSYPQLVAFNVLPAPGSDGPVLVVDRVPYAAALARLNPTGGRPLGARRAYARALAALDPREPQQAAMIADLGQVDLDALEAGAIDLLTYGAGRSRLLAATSIEHYRAILSALDPGVRRELAERQGRGEALRPITLGIGGLDLDMGKAVARAAEQAPTRSVSAPAGPREEWRDDAAGLPEPVMPGHGLAAVRPAGGHRVEIGRRPDGRRGKSVHVLYGSDGPDARSRKLLLDADGRAETIERVEELAPLRYRFERAGSELVARRLEFPAVAARAPAGVRAAPLPAGLALLEMRSEPDPMVDPPSVPVRVEASIGGEPRSIQSEVPRSALLRLVAGRAAFPAESVSPAALVPAQVSETDAVMVLSTPSRWAPPWEGGGTPRPGEEDPLRVAAGLREAWAEAASPRGAVVGVDVAKSPQRWKDAPRVGADALLMLPHDAFPVRSVPGRDELARAWTPLRQAAELGESPPPLVVLVSAESPGVFAARLRRLARDPALRGKLLAGWCLSGEVREDLPASLLAEGNLAAIGLASATVTDLRRASAGLGELARALSGATEPTRVERLPGPFVWLF